MAKLTWDGNRRRTNQKVVRQPGIRAATHAEALMQRGRAEAKLAPHHANNAADPRPDSYFTTSQGTVDAFVNFHDPDGGALPIALFLDVFGDAAFPNHAEGLTKAGRRRRKPGRRKK